MCNCQIFRFRLILIMFRPQILASMEVLKVANIDMFRRANARKHRTDFYEIVKRNLTSTVLRRGQSFFMAVRLKNRNYQDHLDILRVTFQFGKKKNTMTGKRLVF